MTFLRLLLLKILLLLASNSFADSSWYQPMVGFSGSKVKLIQSSYYDNNNEKSHIFALRFKVQDGWKIYGKDSIGIGIAPSFNLETSSKNIDNYNFYWPNPKRVSQKIGDQSFSFDVYEGDVVIPFELFGEIVDGQSISLDLSYGVCNDICVPVNNKITFVVKKVINEGNLSLIAKYLDDFEVKDSIVDEDKVGKPSNNYFAMNTLLYFMSIAFVGGLILNIMPCVLPVLSIKLISILKSRRYNHNIAKLSFFYTFCGIMASFLFLAILSGLISVSGEVFNWGVQFQSPLFLSTLIVIFTVYIANILGYFSFASSYQFSNFLNKKVESSNAKKRLFLSNFFSGILAVLLATPCSAPFLGTAISFSVIQPVSYSFIIFLMMGLGFATPYLILIAYPKAINYLPKSGHWMITFRNVLALFVLVTATWICYVLARNTSVEVGFSVMVMSILLVLSFKINFRSLRTIGVATLIVAIFAMPYSDDFEILETSYQDIKKDKIWQYFERPEIDKFVSQGKVVVVDVTADWCLTCKFNQYRVLESEEVMSALADFDVIAMRADITKPNKSVMDFMNSYSRYAIPFNIVFGPNAKEGILLSELLDKKELLATIKRASN